MRAEQPVGHGCSEKMDDEAEQQWVLTFVMQGL